jgi:dihydroneopterin aldolase
MTGEITSTTVFVRGLRLEAFIGVHEHEKQHRQALIIDVEIDVAAEGWRALAQTLDYERIASHARGVAAAGHIGLVESFAERLAAACMAEPRALRVRVRVDKPEALAPDAAGAGVEIVMKMIPAPAIRP